MSSHNNDAGSNSPASNANLVIALHSAMETSVKTNQTQLSEPLNKKTPPEAPPSITDEQFKPRTRQSRSQSMTVKSTQTSGRIGYQVPGQLNGQVVPFNPQEVFDQMNSETHDSFPRSSLQLPESSTILHPSSFAQIVHFNTTYASGTDFKGRPRRHTISGAHASELVPSQYRGVLQRKEMEQRKKALEEAKKKQEAENNSNTDNNAASTTSESSLKAMSEPATVVQSQLHMQHSEGPRPSPPRKPRRKPSSAEGEDVEDEEEEEDENENKENKTASGDATSSSLLTVNSADKSPFDISASQSPSTQSDSYLQVYGLQYEGGLIDFVDHPPTSTLPSASNSTQTSNNSTPSSSNTPCPAPSPMQSPLPSRERNEDMLNMERAMSPHPSSS